MSTALQSGALRRHGSGRAVGFRKKVSGKRLQASGKERGQKPSAENATISSGDDLVERSYYEIKS
jgi:hypothetical protein